MMLTVPKMTVTRDAAWRTFRRTPDARLRERYHCLLLLIDGKSCPDIARWWYREEDTMRSRVHAFKQGGLQGLAREAIPGPPA